MPKTMPAKNERVRGDFYPPIEPYMKGKLPVPGGHSIYFEVCGNPKGLPVVFVHGGPGGGCSPLDRQFFNPKRYRIVLFDQRGCGRSTPYASLRNNTTTHLIADMELLRSVLEIDSWVVFGGSWGSTLALAYGEAHPERTKALIVRGIFFGTGSELDWLYQEGGASQVFPEFWEHFVAPIPKSQRHDMISAYYKLLTHKDPAVRLRAAKAWSIWEGSCSKLHVDPNLIAHFAADEVAVAIARIECHYFMNNCFFRGKNQILRRIATIKNIPGVIVQGRYDMVCPKVSAEALHLAWPTADYIVVPDAGHSRTEPGIRYALVEAADRFSKLPK